MMRAVKGWMKGVVPMLVASKATSRPTTLCEKGTRPKRDKKGIAMLERALSTMRRVVSSPVWFVSLATCVNAPMLS